MAADAINHRLQTASAPSAHATAGQPPRPKGLHLGGPPVPTPIPTAVKHNEPNRADRKDYRKSAAFYTVTVHSASVGRR